MFSVDTEILTDSGWLGVGEFEFILTDVKVLSKDINTNNVFYKKIKDISIHQICNKDIYSIEGLNVSGKFTNDTKLYARKTKLDDYGLIPIIDCFSYKQFYLTNYFEWGKFDPKLSPTKDKFLYELVPHQMMSGIDWIHLCVIRLFGASSYRQGYLFSRHLKELTDILNKYLIPYTYIEDNVYITNFLIVNALAQFGEGKNRQIPPEYLQVGDNGLQEILECLMRYNNYELSKYEFCRTLSPTLADSIQELLLKLGKSAKIIVKQAKLNTSIHMIERVPQYKVSYNDKKEFNIQHRNRKIRKESGQFAKVDNNGHLFLLRRNGKVMWANGD